MRVGSNERMNCRCCEQRKSSLETKLGVVVVRGETGASHVQPPSFKHIIWSTTSRYCVEMFIRCI